MFRLHHLFLLATLPSVALGNTTFSFSGVCSDCTGDGTATLVLQNYTLGTSITGDNFVSFSYSSNLVTMNVDSTNQTSISGEIDNNLPNFETFQVDCNNDCISTNYEGQFTSDTAGNWTVSGYIPTFDTGTAGTWSSVPEPGSAVLILTGAALLICRRRSAARSLARPLHPARTNERKLRELAY